MTTYRVEAEYDTIASHTRIECDCGTLQEADKMLAFYHGVMFGNAGTISGIGRIVATTVDVSRGFKFERAKPD